MYCLVTGGLMLFALVCVQSWVMIVHSVKVSLSSKWKCEERKFQFLERTFIFICSFPHSKRSDASLFHPGTSRNQSQTFDFVGMRGDTCALVCHGYTAENFLCFCRLQDGLYSWAVCPRFDYCLHLWRPGFVWTPSQIQKHSYGQTWTFYSSSLRLVASLALLPAMCRCPAFIHSFIYLASIIVTK
jgi:hypothetical protein